MTSPSTEPSLEGFVSVRVGDQMIGVPLLRVQDVIAPVRIDRVPLGRSRWRGR